MRLLRQESDPATLTEEHRLFRARLESDIDADSGIEKSKTQDGRAFPKRSINPTGLNKRTVRGLARQC